MLYSSKQHLFLVVFELSGPTGVIREVVLYWEQTNLQSVSNQGSSVRGLCISLISFIILEVLLSLRSLISPAVRL